MPGSTPLGTPSQVHQTFSELLLPQGTLLLLRRIPHILLPRQSGAVLARELPLLFLAPPNTPYFRSLCGNGG